MIIRLTSKLAKKIGETRGPSRPLDPNPFADWTARLFTVERVQYIMVTNTASLYSTVMFGAGITHGSEFIKHTLSSIREVLFTNGYEFIYERLIVPATGTVYFSRALNRGVTGSMNDLVLQAQYILAGGMVAPCDVAPTLNETLLSYLGYSNPKKAFSQMKVD